MVRSLRRPPVRGTEDPDLPGHVLVPVRKPVPGLPKINYSVPDTSFYRVNKRTNKVTAIVTVTPNGISIGWDSCGQCSLSVRLCECHSGVSCPNSVAHIYVMSGGQKPERPMPLAVPFQSPVRPIPPIQPVKPKRQLRRRAQEAEDAAIAEAEINNAVRKLKRKTR
jgi:hypothetical protein